VAVQTVLAYGRGFMALVEGVEPPELAEATNRLRSSQGGRYVTADGPGLRLAFKHLRDGGLLAIIADRDIHGNGVCVRLAGREVRVSRGPWELAQRTGARIVPVFTPRLRGGRYGVLLGEPILVDRRGGEAAVQRAAQEWVSRLEGYLRSSPGQWTVLEDFWEVHGCGKG
jgi:KDO2-lipid IV(A) lauroyltransferase